MTHLYDATTHITARELRANRMVLPDYIPDRAWIARTAVHPKMMSKVAGGQTFYYMGADLDAPFLTEDGPVTALLGPSGKPINDNRA
jgi:hypothetical protein